MRAGNLIHRVTLQRATETNVDGESIKSYSDVGTYWAFVGPVTGNEMVSLQQVQAVTECAVTMRYIGDIYSGDRLLFKTRKLEVLYPINVDEKNQEMKVQCREKHG